MADAIELVFRPNSPHLPGPKTPPVGHIVGVPIRSCCISRKDEMDISEDKYKVIVDNENHYSVVPFGNAVVKGWRDTGSAGTREECLEYIEEVWTDMRPVDLSRIRMKLGLR